MVEIATDIPIIILGFISSIIIALLTLGYIYRTSFPMSTFWFLSGSILLIIFISVNTISIGSLNVNQTYNNVTDTIINTYAPDTFPIKVYDGGTETYTLEPNFIGIMLIILSLAFIMVGVLIEKW